MSLLHSVIVHCSLRRHVWPSNETIAQSVSKKTFHLFKYSLLYLRSYLCVDSKRFVHSFLQFVSNVIFLSVLTTDVAMRCLPSTKGSVHILNSKCTWIISFWKDYISKAINNGSMTVGTDTFFFPEIRIKSANFENDSPSGARRLTVSDWNVMQIFYHLRKRQFVLNISFRFPMERQCFHFPN